MRRSNVGWGIVLSLFTMTSTGWAQPDYLGTKTPYAPPHAAYTPAPAGYQPVFIDYVGRHGARFLTKAGTDQHVVEALAAAEKNNGLTEMGRQALVIAQHIQAAGKGNYENITLSGREEQQAIGERMQQLYGPVFKGKGLEVVTTWKMRTQQSAESFLRGLASYSGEKKYTRAADTTDTVLRFYDLSPNYLRYKKSAALKRSLDSLDKDPRMGAVARRVCARLFKPGFVPGAGVDGNTAADGGMAFVDDLYDLYAIAWAMSGELRQQGNPGDSQGLGMAFEQADLQWLDFRSGAADFLEKGPAFDAQGVQVKVAVPLLADFIKSLDRATSGAGAGDAILRFTHAEAISPFAALLGIQEASSPVRSIYRYQDHWNAGKVIPLSANIQWILYADGAGHHLVKVLLNEREVRLPVATLQWPYYRWEDLRAYYVGRLSAIGAGLDTDMKQYLKGVE